MQGRLEHPVVCRVRSTCSVGDEALLWDWLVENLDRRCFFVQSTELEPRGFRRATDIAFSSELDARRFRTWALGRGFLVE